MSSSIPHKDDIGKQDERVIYNYLLETGGWVRTAFIETDCRKKIYGGLTSRQQLNTILKRMEGKGLLKHKNLGMNFYVWKLNKAVANKYFKN